MNQISGVVTDYLYISAGYDYGNLSNPVHYRVVSDNYILIDENLRSYNSHHLHANLAYNDDNTSTRFYSVDYQRVTLNYPIKGLLATTLFYLDEKYDVYVPYIDYQPVLNSSRDIPDSSNDENIMSIHYFMFYFIAQIGGFLGFFMLLIGAKIKSMNDTYLMYKSINDYNFVLHEIMKKNANNELQSEQAVNIRDSRNDNNHSQNNDRHPIVHEDDPLMNQNEGGSSDEQEHVQHQQPVPYTRSVYQNENNNLHN